MEQVRIFIVEVDPMMTSISKRSTEKMAPFKVLGINNNKNDARLNSTVYVKSSLALLLHY